MIAKAARGSAVFLWTVLVVASSVQPCAAGGREFALQTEDLQIRTDTRWAGCGQGGYYPVRITLLNTGPARTLTFRFDPRRVNSNLPVVEQTVTAEQNATLGFTLSVPMVGSGAHGTLAVVEDGEELEGLTQSISLADVDTGGPHSPALLVISHTHVDPSRLDEAVRSVISASSGQVSLIGPGGRTVALDSQVVPPAMLPDRWIDYSGLDLVAVSLQTFAGLPEENRTAILEWVHCGGTLLMYDVGRPARESKELKRLLALDGDDAAASGWQSADPGQRRAIPIVAADSHSGMPPMRSYPSGARIRGRPPLLRPGSMPPQTDAAPPGRPEFVWPGTSDAFARRDLMLGTVFAFPENPFPGSAHDWAWLLSSLGPERYRWMARHGLSARKETREFLNFLIPGVKGVPVYAFLTLITLFTITIGPLNYFLLWKRKRLYFLIVTIPAIALATSLALFGYSAVAHGFGIKSRGRSFTLLDQRTNTAVTTTRLALFAGMAPSEGLRFSPETAVYTVWPRARDFENGTVDWTETQSLQSGWLRSRTRTQFLLVSHRTVRERLVVDAPSERTLDVANGFEWEIEALVVADERGELYFGQDLAAGASRRLTRATTADLSDVAQLLRRHPLEEPDDVKSNYSGSMFDADRRFRRRHYSMMRGGEASARYNESRTERWITQVQQDLPGGPGLPAKTYLAVFRENPGIDYGVETSSEQIPYHVLLGKY